MAIGKAVTVTHICKFRARAASLLDLGVAPEVGNPAAKSAGPA